MSPESRTRSRTRSRSPLKRTYDNKSRDGRSRGQLRQVRDKESRVYVSNINYDMKWMELKDIMKKIGNVEHVEVFTDNEGRSKGCAVVEFTHSQDAERAIKELDGSEIRGRKVKVREDIMDDSTYKEQLKTQKDKSRTLKDQQLTMNANAARTGFMAGGISSGGIGAGAALGGLNAGLGGLGALSSLGALGGVSSLLGGQTSTVLQLLSMLNTKGGEPIISTVFVSNLDYEINWQKLKDLMRGAGNCLRCDIQQDDSNRSKGYGTVVFETPMEALTCVALYNGFEVSTSHRKMSVRLDRNSPVHQILAQLGVSSTDITQNTLQQLQQIATLAVLGATSGLTAGALGGLGGLGAVGGLGLGGISALTGATNAYSTLQNQASTQAANLGQLSGLGGLGLTQQLQSIGGLLHNRGTGSTGLTGGGASNGNSSMLGSSFGFDSTSQSQSSYGLQNLSSFGGSSGGTTSRLSDSGMRGYSSASASGASTSAGSKVFVRNLPFSFTWQALKDKFRDAGRVLRADLKTDEKQRSKGCGTVTFETSAEAHRAIALFNGSRIEGREIEVRPDRY